MIVWLVIGLIFLCFAVLPIFFRGAPYVPTHKKAIKAILDELNLKKGSVVVDLGSGDGAFLAQAASRGLRAVGYEINPFLCVIAWLRCRKQKPLVKILWRDFWSSQLPDSTEVIFVFLASSHMSRLAKKIQAQSSKSGRQLLLVSYGFSLPNNLAAKKIGGAYIYKFKPRFTN